MWYVEVRRFKGHVLEREIGPYALATMAETADRGINRNLDRKRFYTIVVFRKTPVGNKK